MVDHNTEVKHLMLWLQYRGGWGQGTRTRNNDRAPHQEWVWTTTEDDRDYVALSTLSPVTVSEVDVLDTWRISGHGVLVVVDEEPPTDPPPFAAPLAAPPLATLPRVELLVGVGPLV